MTLTVPLFANHTAGLTTVILVRHAEKATDPGLEDPPLSAEGAARSRSLASVLASSGVSVIYTTPYERTRQTAAPLAAALSLTPVEVKAGATYANDLAARIRAEHSGDTVLVVGHSNTTQDVIRALGIEDAPAIAESEFDYLFIVTIGTDVEPRLVTLHY